MTELEKKIREHYKKKGATDEWLEKYFDNSVSLSRLIAMYAHENQYRVNGDNYFSHPENLMNRYRAIVGLFKFDGDAAFDCGIPYYGVQELCFLHDVVEDTDITIEDIRGVFKSCKRMFCSWTILKDALIAITHKKDELFDDYYNRVLENPLASFVKLLDIEDNLKLLNLMEFTEKEYARAKRYLDTFNRINEKYHYVEKLEKYRKMPRNIYDDWDDFWKI